MGVVYRAWDLVNEEPVALKVLAEHGYVARFDREIELLEGLEHPSIGKYVGHGVLDGGLRYLAIRWIEGTTLLAHLRARGLSVREAVATCQIVASALEHVHGLGIIHRDIKPTNIMLEHSDPNRPKLIDFGIARSAQVSALTQTGDLLGTPGFMSPEQARGSRDIGFEADVFSLGCVLYFCLAGRGPFAGSSLASLMSKVVLSAPPSLASLVPGVPDNLSSLVDRILNKNPRERPQLSDITLELALCLDSIPAGAPTAKAPTGALRTVADITTVKSATQYAACIVARRLTGGSSAFDDAVCADLARLPGVNVSPIASGEVVMVLDGYGEARQAAVDAVSAAQRVVEIAPDARLVLSIGSSRGEDCGPVLESATLLEEGEHTVAQVGHVEVDANTAALLRDAGYEVSGEKRLWLVLPDIGG